MLHLTQLFAGYFILCQQLHVSAVMVGHNQACERKSSVETNIAVLFCCFTVHFNSVNPIYQLLHLYTYKCVTLFCVTLCCVTLCCRITTLNSWRLNFNFGDFSKEPMNPLMMIWMMIETCWSVFKCFNINILD
jgi:hypothetical protein